jgi:hypothetical protein
VRPFVSIFKKFLSDAEQGISRFNNICDHRHDLRKWTQISLSISSFMYLSFQILILNISCHQNFVFVSFFLPLLCSQWIFMILAFNFNRGIRFFIKNAKMILIININIKRENI